MISDNSSATRLSSAFKYKTNEYKKTKLPFQNATVFATEKHLLEELAFTLEAILTRISVESNATTNYEFFRENFWLRLLDDGSSNSGFDIDADELQTEILTYLLDGDGVVDRVSLLQEFYADDLAENVADNPSDYALHGSGQSMSESDDDGTLSGLKNPSYLLQIFSQFYWGVIHRLEAEHLTVISRLPVSTHLLDQLIYIDSIQQDMLTRYTGEGAADKMRDIFVKISTDVVEAFLQSGSVNSITEEMIWAWDAAHVGESFSNAHTDRKMGQVTQKKKGNFTPLSTAGKITHHANVIQILSDSVAKRSFFDGEDLDLGRLQPSESFDQAEHDAILYQLTGVDDAHRQLSEQLASYDGEDDADALAMRLEIEAKLAALEREEQVLSLQLDDAENTHTPHAQMKDQLPQQIDEEATEFRAEMAEELANIGQSVDPAVWGWYQQQHGVLAIDEHKTLPEWRDVSDIAKAYIEKRKARYAACKDDAARAKEVKNRNEAIRKAFDNAYKKLFEAIQTFKAKKHNQYGAFKQRPQREDQA